MPTTVPRLLGPQGRFTVRRRLGAGEFADVYDVWDRKLGQRVALKRARLRSPRREVRRLLAQEFAALSRLAHENLPRPHEAFIDGVDAYFTMELIEGPDLIDYVRADVRSPRSLTASAFVGCGSTGIERLRRAVPQLVAALEAFHATGLVHRDLQPGNVRVTFSGRLVVLDYGLACSVADATPASIAAVVGTAAYMAPEQHERGAHLAAGDWYSVGVLLFEALTGTRPFAGDDHGVFIKKRTLVAPRASSLVPDIPADLDAICAGLLERDPAARLDGPSVRSLLRDRTGG